MMMNGRHAEDPLARQLERTDLNDYRESFQHEDTAHLTLLQVSLLNLEILLVYLNQL